GEGDGQVVPVGPVLSGCPFDLFAGGDGDVDEGAVVGKGDVDDSSVDEVEGVSAVTIFDGVGVGAQGAAFRCCLPVGGAGGGGELVDDEESGAAHAPIYVGALEGSVVDDGLDASEGLLVYPFDELDGGVGFLVGSGYPVDAEYDPAAGVVAP